jgi:hypothetical protein
MHADQDPAQDRVTFHESEVLAFGHSHRRRHEVVVG